MPLSFVFFFQASLVTIQRLPVRCAPNAQLAPSVRLRWLLACNAWRGRILQFLPLLLAFPAPLVLLQVPLV